MARLGDETSSASASAEKEKRPVEEGTTTTPARTASSEKDAEVDETGMRDLLTEANKMLRGLSTGPSEKDGKEARVRELRDETLS